VGQWLNDRLQVLIGGRRDLRAHVGQKVRGDWLVAQAMLIEAGVDVRGARTLEIGTGWIPVFPLCFSIAGAKTCITVDLSRHLMPSVVPTLLRQLEQYLSEISTASRQSQSEVVQRHRAISEAGDGQAMLAAAGVRYAAPFDASATGLAGGSIDLVYSNSVLEHVSESVLDALMRELHRVLRPGGVAIHGVNCGDHYAYFDRRISQLNYLKYSHASWRKWNNALQYQNRLRPSDFIRSATEAGLEVVAMSSRPKLELLERLPEASISRDFKHYSREDLSTTSVDFILRRP